MNAILSENVFFQIAAQFARVNSTCLAIFVASTIVLGLIFWYRSPNPMTSEAEADSSSGSRLPLGNSGYPLIGETVEFVADGRTFFRTRRQKYGPVFRSHLCCWPTVVVTGAENVQKVLTASDSTLTYFSPLSVVRLLGRGSLASSAGKRHSHLQRSIMRLLAPRVIARLVAPIQKIVRDHVARWTGETPPAVVSGSDCCQTMLLAVVSQCLFGFDLGAEELARITRLLGVFSDGMLSFPVNLPGFAFHKAMQARIELDRFIAKRTSSMACSNADEPSLLGLLHSAEGAVPQSGTVDLVLELIFGAKETTASAMCTALIEVSESVDVLSKLRRELTEHKVTPGGTPVDYSVLARLNYLNDVVKEVLRIQPPVAGGFRRTQKPFQIQDYVIPSGWMILYCITDTHETSSSSLEDFARFDPDRWRRARERASEDNHEEESSSTTTTTTTTTSPWHESSTTRTPNRTAQEETRQDNGQSALATHVNDRFGYIPFGGGNRRFCVGKNLAKTIISIFLIELTNQMDRWKLPNGRPQIRTAPFPLPKDRLPVIFFPWKNLDSDRSA